MLHHCIAAENRKLRGSPIWVVFFLLPVLSAAYGTFNFLQNQGVLRFNWYNLWTQHTLFYALFFFSPLVGLYAAYLWRLEHLGHNWNLIMSQPVPPLYLFLAKLAVVFKMALLTQGWMLTLYLLSGKLWAKLPGLPPAEVFLWALRGALAAAPVIALQLLLAMLIRSFAVPILIALGGGLAGVVLSSRGLGLVWPYSPMIAGMNSNKTEDALAGSEFPFMLSCLVFLAVFLLAADCLLRKRDVKA